MSCVSAGSGIARAAFQLTDFSPPVSRRSLQLHLTDLSLAIIGDSLLQVPAVEPLPANVLA